MPVVLLIEDHAPDWKVITKILKGIDSNLQIVHCIDGLDAFLYFEGMKQQPFQVPDLILVDMIMPRMGGVDFIQTLREHKKYGDWKKRVPIVVLTGVVDQDQIDAAYEAGASAVFRKPHLLPDLRQAIKMIASVWLDAVEPPTKEEG